MKCCYLRKPLTKSLPPPSPAARRWCRRGQPMFDLRQLEGAHGVVGAAMPPTPAYAWPLLSERLGGTVVVKHENHTPIGAFKVRGGLVYVERLKRERTQVNGIVSATRGNHGQSLAFAGR